MAQTDPTGEIYQMLDEVGLTAGNLLATREPMSKIVNTMRGQIAARVKQMIDEREVLNRKENNG